METRTLTKAETAELYKLRVPTLGQLVFLAEQCGHESSIVTALAAYPNADRNDKVVILDYSNEHWNPGERLHQNHQLLAAVIAKGDCKLFYDDGINEFFIYRWVLGPETEPPLAHGHKLNEVVLEAALELWFPQ